jgi:phage terminase large subunit-like protein
MQRWKMDNNKYIPGEEALKFIAFIRAAAVEDNANAEIHYKLADKYFGTDKQVLIEAFRGSAKSTMMEWLVIYVAALGHLPNFGKVEFIAFIGDSAENGVKNFFRNVAGKIDRSEFLQSLIAVKRKTDGEMELVNADGIELNIKGYGAGTNIRGVRYKGARPDIVVLDDITTNDAITSETIQNTINNNFYKSVIPALHPTRFKMFFIGTPISERDLIHQLSNNPEWVVHKFPICEKYPCSKDEFKGNWEDRFPYEAIKSKYDMYKASGKSQDFAQEYMLELLDLSDLLVDESDIKWYDPAKVVKNRSNYNFYVSTDFATSTKKSADFSTIGVWAINNNGDWMLVDGQCKRQSMQENLDDLFKYVARWKPLSVGIESSGQQGGFISILEDMMINRNTWFTIAKKRGSRDYGIRPSGDKVTRFVTGVQPMFKQGKVWFPKPELTEKANPKLFELVEEMEHELSKLTLAGGVKALKHDDAIDLLNQLSEMDIFKPSEQTNASEKIDGYLGNDGELWWPEEKEEDYGGSTIF